MGTKGREILKEMGVDVEELISKLNSAFADEWLAYYQYWLGAKVAVGVPREAVVGELIQHATEELRHADMLAERIIQLGGTPLLEPKVWYDHTGCGYHPPKDFNIRTIIDQNIEGEQCAIGVYRDILNYTQGKDHATYDIALQILQDELEHEEDLEAIKEDIETMFKK
ncbi:MAG: ferritin-like domain-containing protein [Candidatus Omnitrophota bacterium]